MGTDFHNVAMCSMVVSCVTLVLLGIALPMVMYKAQHAHMSMALRADVVKVGIFCFEQILSGVFMLLCWYI